MKKKPAREPAPPVLSKRREPKGTKPADRAGLKPEASAKPGASASRSKSKKLEISPIAKRALLSSRLPRSPVGEAGATKLNKGQIDAIRQFAVALAEDGLGSDEDTVLICNRTTETPAIPLSELLYDTCRWCESDIYYDRLMPSPPGMMRVCVPCGIMLLEAEKKGRN